MQQAPMLFPIASGGFWKQTRIAIEEVANEKSSLQF
jgi:hypothetical protein